MAAQTSFFTSTVYTGNTMTTFGERLKTHRKSRGIGLFRLSQMTGVSEPNIASIEAGRRPASEDVLRRIANSPEMEIEFAELRAWQILEKSSPSQLGILKDELSRILSYVAREVDKSDTSA